MFIDLNFEYKIKIDLEKKIENKSLVTLIVPLFQINLHQQFYVKSAFQSWVIPIARIEFWSQSMMTLLIVQVVNYLTIWFVVETITKDKVVVL